MPFFLALKQRFLLGLQLLQPASDDLHLVPLVNCVFLQPTAHFPSLETQFCGIYIAIWLEFHHTHSLLQLDFQGLSDRILPISRTIIKLMNAQIPQKLSSFEMSPLEYSFLHDLGLQFRRDKDYLKGNIDQIQLNILFLEVSFILNLVLLMIKLVIRYLCLAHKYICFVLSSLIHILMLSQQIIQVQFYESFLRKMRSNQSLKVHQSIPHILKLRLEHTLDLVQRQQLRRILLILGSYNTLLFGPFFESILLSFFIDNLGMMMKKALEEEMLDLEHIHLGLVLSDLNLRVVFILSDPINGIAALEDTDFRQGKPQLPRVFLPLNQILNQTEVMLLMKMVIVLLRKLILVLLDQDLAVLVEVDLLADSAPAPLVVEFVVDGAVQKPGY